MPYRRVAFAQAECYHVPNRGSRHSLIFLEADNDVFLLSRVKEYAQELQITVEEWPYSSYLEWTGVRSGTLVERAFIRLHFEDAGA